MREYSGAVLFIDLLGFGHLTGNGESVDENDFSAHKFPKKNISNQIFSAYILAKFRKQLLLERNKSIDIRVAQLSDCAFVWSESSDLILEFSRSIMWRCAMDGLLCRAGIAYGQIVEPSKIANSVGDYICGSAVTDAVKYERSGKGARVFTDTEFPSKCAAHFPEAFKPRISTVDYKTADEFCWYLYTGDMSNAYPANLKKAKPERVRLIVELMGSYLYSPKFCWNAKSHLGLIQLASTIDIIARSYNDLGVGKLMGHSFEQVMRNDLVRGGGGVNSYIHAMSRER